MVHRFQQTCSACCFHLYTSDDYWEVSFLAIVTFFWGGGWGHAMYIIESVIGDHLMKVISQFPKLVFKIIKIVP